MKRAAQIRLPRGRQKRREGSGTESDSDSGSEVETDVDTVQVDGAKITTKQYQFIQKFDALTRVVKYISYLPIFRILTL